MRVKCYEELVVWQKVMLLTKIVYGVQKQLPKEETYGLGDRIRRVVVSIPSNIAEGFCRESDKEFRRFRYNCPWATFETNMQLQLAQDLGYL